MDKDLAELVNATRRLGRPLRNQPVSGSAARRRRGERLLKSIRKCGSLPQPRIISSESAEPEPRPDIFTAISGFGQRLAETLNRISTPPLQRHFTPVTDASGAVIKRRTSRRKTTKAEEFAPSGPDQHAQKLALAGIAMICFFAVGVILLTAPSDQGARSQAIARQALQPSPPATEIPVPKTAPTPFSQTAIAGNIPIDDVE